MSGYIGTQPVPQATQTRDTFTATAGQTSFATSGYTPGYLDVFLNGVHLVNGTDYTATNGSDVVLTSGAASGDNLEVVAYTTFQVVDQAFSGNFSVDSPTFVVDAATNRVGIGNSSPSATLHTTKSGVEVARFTNSQSNGGDWEFKIGGGGFEDRKFMLTDKYSGADSVRMAVDSSGNVGIGTSSPAYKLSITGTANTGIASFEGNNNGNLPGTDGDATLVIGTNWAAGSAEADYFHNKSAFKNTVGGHRFLQRTGASTASELMWLRENLLTFSTAGTERMRVTSVGDLAIGQTGATCRLDVYSSAGAGTARFVHSGGFAFGTVITLETISGSDDPMLSFKNYNGGSPTSTGLRGIDQGGIAFMKDGGVSGFGSTIGTIYSTGGDIFQFHQNRNGTSPYFYFNTSGTYGVFSDERLKRNIVELPQEASVNLIRNIRPVEFNWKEEYGDASKRVIGFLAQEVLANATTEGQKNILTNWETYDESDPDCPHLGLSDQRMLPSMVGTIQHLLAVVEEQQAIIEQLKADVAALKGA